MKPDPNQSDAADLPPKRKSKIRIHQAPLRKKGMTVLKTNANESPAAATRQRKWNVIF